MFKHCIIILLVLIPVLNVNSANKNREHLLRAVQLFIEERCVRNCDKTTFDELMKSKAALDACVLEAIYSDDATTDDKAIDLVCNDMRTKLHSCITSILDILEPCLNEEEKYFPNFILEWYNSTFEEHCKDEAKILKKHRHEITVDDLRCEAMNKVQDELLEMCFATSSVIKDLETPDFVVTKESLCTYLQPGNVCFLNFLKEFCNAEVYKFFEFHLRPTKTWCVEYANETNN